MPADLEFIVGQLDGEDPVHVSAEDLDGPYGPALRRWQAWGFLGREPVFNPVAGCPHCGEGIPYRLAGRHLCNRCRSTIGGRHFHLWPLNLEAFLRWLAAALRLRGEPRPVDDRLWHLGTWESRGGAYECFFRRTGRLSGEGRERLSAYRSVIVLYGIRRPEEADTAYATYVSLLSLLRLGQSLSVTSLQNVLRGPGRVRFDARSGVLTAGDLWMGEVPAGSREYYFLRCLAEQIDAFVPYADIKHFVMQNTGGRDSTDEATFCQRLKNRIKEKNWVPTIDRLIVTTNKGDGYRLRGNVPPDAES